jgi:hypothetical protein
MRVAIVLAAALACSSTPWAVHPAAATTIVPPIADQDAFAGESATIDLCFDYLNNVNACANGKVDGKGGPINLSSVSFSATNGSRLSVSS